MAPNLTADARSATVTRSFRFDAEMSKILDEEAERMGVSVNALVGIILKRYSEFIENRYDRPQSRIINIFARSKR
jgi:hypothetical protein